MSWVFPVAPGTAEPADVLGGKGHGLVAMTRLGLPVPPAFVVTTAACRAYLATGRFPPGLDAELDTALRALPPLVSVRSGAATSMPGMMNTVLNLGARPGDTRFAQDVHRRFLGSWTATVGSEPVPADPRARLDAAIRAVFASWNTPRAITYRELHDIPHGLGTAVVVQAMVFGNRDEHSGAGVAFSRDPDTGANTLYGDVVVGGQGDDVVSGEHGTRPLSELAVVEPPVADELRTALHRLEGHFRDACQVEFTYETGRLWLLQVRAGGLTGRAAVRVAVDLADERLIDRRTALRRISPAHLRDVHVRRVRVDGGLLARGRGAGPGVATGRIALTSDRAARLAADGPVILVRPSTSPLDMPGLAAAAGVVTSRGGPTSHAAVVARSLGRPAVVDAAEVLVDPAAGCLRVGERIVPEGTVVTIDGTGGEIVLGVADSATSDDDASLERLLGWADDVSGDRSPRPAAERLRAARDRL